MLVVMLVRLKHFRLRAALVSAVRWPALIFCLCVLNGSYLNGSAQTKPPMLRLSCRVITLDSASDGTSGQVSVSNLKRIQLDIKLSGSQLPSGGLTLKDDKQRASNEPVVEIIVNMISNDGKVAVPVDARVRGFGMRPGEQHITVVMEIPDKAKRKRDIDDYLRRMEERALKEGRAAEFERLVKRNRAVAVAGFERLYVNNRVGDFEVVCQYTSHKPGASKDTVRSEPIRIRVKFEGNFFDQPNFN